MGTMTDMSVVDFPGSMSAGGLKESLSFPNKHISSSVPLA
jgi:hypothetical protein